MDTDKLLDLATELLIEVAPKAIRGSREAVEALESGTRLIQQMRDENDRDPTEDEWGDLNARIAEVRSNIHED